MRRCDALLQFLVGLAQLLFGLDQPLGLPRPLQRLVDDRRQQLHEHRALDEVVVGAAFHHFHGHAFAAVSRGHDERHPPAPGLEPFDELLAAHVGQAVVQQDEAGRILLQPSQCRSAVGHAHRAMAAGREVFLDQLQQGGVVFDDEDRLRPSAPSRPALIGCVGWLAADMVAFSSPAELCPLGRRGVRLAGIEPATYGLGNRCSIP